MKRMTAAILTAVVMISAGCASRGRTGRSALEKDASGWTDLMPSPDLKDCIRVALPPGAEPSKRNPWAVSADGKTLSCSAAEDVFEALLFKPLFTDGIFHVEWRFRKSEREGYNSGVYVRTSKDALVWHQAQVARKAKRPIAGDFLGKTLVDGKPGDLTEILSQLPDRANPPGEWNTFEITCVGDTLTLWFNGAVTATWMDVKVTGGHVGLQAEKFDIDFRNVKFKPF